jgi:predicted alpha/beta hydrolase
VKHKEGTYKGLKDFNIYYQAWLPDKKPVAVLLIAHGFAEHSGRYANVVDHFVPLGYAVYALDHRGHGRSDGPRVHVDDFSEYIKDLKTFFNIVRKENPKDKIFLIGHSMVGHRPALRQMSAKTRQTRHFRRQYDQTLTLMRPVNPEVLPTAMLPRPGRH